MLFDDHLSVIFRAFWTLINVLSFRPSKKMLRSVLSFRLPFIFIHIFCLCFLIVILSITLERSSCVIRLKSSSTADAIAAADLSETPCLSQVVATTGKCKLFLDLLFGFLFCNGAEIILAKGRLSFISQSPEEIEPRPGRSPSPSSASSFDFLFHATRRFVAAFLFGCRCSLFVAMLSTLIDFHEFVRAITLLSLI